MGKWNFNWFCKKMLQTNLHMKCEYVQIHTNTCNTYQKQYTPINPSTYHNIYHNAYQYKPWSPILTNMHTFLHWCTWHDLKWPDVKRFWPFGVFTIYDQTINKKREREEFLHVISCTLPALLWATLASLIRDYHPQNSLQEGPCQFGGWGLISFKRYPQFRRF